MKIQQLLGNKYFLISAIIANILLFFLLTGIIVKTCITFYNTLTTPAPKNEIILIDHTINYAWEPTNLGYFIDGKGNLYTFDLIKYKYNTNSDTELVKILYHVKENSHPVSSVNPKYINILYNLSKKINANAPTIKRLNGIDMGSNSIMMYNSDLNTHMTINTYGDYIIEPIDFYAKLVTTLYKVFVVNKIEEGIAYKNRAS